VAKVATAYVDIDARLDKLKARLKAADLDVDLDLSVDRFQIETQLAGLRADLDLDVNRAQIAAQLAGLRVDLGIDVDRFQLNAQLMGLSLDVNIRPDYTSLAQTRFEIEAFLSGIFVNINVTPDWSSVAAARAAINAALAGINANVGAGVAGAAAGGAAAGGVGAGGLALGGLAVAGGAGAAITAGTGFLGLSLASDAEVAEQGFARLMGSVDEAKAHIADLQEFAKTTPFEFTGLRDMSLKFQSAEVSADAIIGLLGPLGDATASLGTGQEGLDRASYALIQMQQSGKVMSTEMRQLTEAGIPAWNALAGELGVTQAEARDLVEKGLVPASEMFEAIEHRSGTGFKKTEGAMEEMATSLKGRLSNLKDTFEITMGEAFKPLLDPMAELVGVVGETLGPLLTDTLVPAFESMMPLIELVLENMGPFVETLVTFGSEVMTALSPALEVLLPALNDLFAEIGDELGQMFLDLAPAFVDIADAMVSLAPLIPPFVDLFSSTMVQILPGLAEGLSLTADAVGRVLGSGLERIVDLLDTMMHGDWDEFTRKVRDWFDAFMRGIDLIIERFEPAWNAVRDIALGVFEAIKFAWNAIDIGFTIPDWIPGIGGRGVDDLFPDIGGGPSRNIGAGPGTGTGLGAAVGAGVAAGPAPGGSAGGGGVRYLSRTIDAMERQFTDSSEVGLFFDSQRVGTALLPPLVGVDRSR
jgi:tape measure domain-containing protein